MTPGRKHALIAAAVLTPPAIYQAREIAQGDDGWPFSRYIRLLPLWLFLTVTGFAFGWFVPHIALPKIRCAR